LPADRTPDGVADMAGNVQEWTSSLYLPYTQAGVLAATWPAPGEADQKPAPAVVRGGSFYATADGADATRRYPLLANQAYGYLGFRCLDGVPLEQLRSTIGAQ
ncbi:hypothetical protein SE17_40165, partial [Kouleothrix aurantiaca]